ncbi:MAG: serine/threonine-protein kinase [Nocardioidaceae bacterium]
MTSLGRYRLLERLGSGSFATVWRGYDPELDAVVAVKVLADNWAGSSDVRERFLNEARILRRLAHPRVVRVHDVGVAIGDDGQERPYFVMDHIGGGTLADRIGRLDASEALRLAADAARAVDVLHEAGIVHRDVKPGNLLVDADCDPVRVLVADLGSAKVLPEESFHTVVTGSPGYMAPEQALSTRGFDARADVYAMGAVAYHLLSGSLPYDTASPAEAVLRAEEPPPPIAQRLGLTRSVDSVLGRALAKDPAHRQASAAVLADELEALAAGRAVSGRLPRRWPVPAVMLVLVLVFASALAVGWLLG